MEHERHAMMAVLDHLQSAVTRGDLNTDALQEAIFAISNAYTLNMHNSATKERYPLDGLSLPDVYKAGRAQLLTSPTENGTAPAAAQSSKCVGEENASGSNEMFHKFVERLRNSTKFFSGVEEGTEDFEHRMKLARDKFEARRAAKRKASSTDTVQPGVERESPATGPRSASEATEIAAKAAELKAQGNEQLRAKNYQLAHDLYSQCIELDKNNPIYYSNRAAAKLHLSRYSEAVEDCKRAIALDAEFLRPREKLAAAYRQLNMVQNEVDALKAALRLAPDNEFIQSSLQDAESRLAGGSAESRSGAMPGTGGMVDSLLGMVSNPDLLQNVSQQMGLPQGMVEQFMNSGGADRMGSMLRDNPQLLQQGMEMFRDMMPPMGGNAAGQTNSGRGNNIS